MTGPAMRGSMCAAALMTTAVFLPQNPMVQAQSPTRIKVVLVGDSTVATGGGWGPGFCAHLSSSVECLDLAVNGRSSKSFIDEGLWAKALEARGNVYLIQFGHNDQKDPPALHTDPGTTFKANLHRYIRDVRQLHGTPVLVTSLSRRNYKDGRLIVDKLREYAAATREVAAEDGVPSIDLYQLSRALLEPMSQQEADRFNATTHEDGKAEGATATTPDRTHLNERGKRTFGDMVAHAASQSVDVLKPYIQDVASAHQ